MYGRPHSETLEKQLRFLQEDNGTPEGMRTSPLDRVLAYAHAFKTPDYTPQLTNLAGNVRSRPRPAARLAQRRERACLFAAASDEGRAPDAA